MMLVGLTYDDRQAYLRQGYTAEQTAEFDAPETIAGLSDALRALGHIPQPIGSAQQLVTALSSGQRWDLVFNIAEGMFGLGREALVPCLLDAYQIPYTFSDPLTLALCLDKAMCKRVLRDLGVPTPDFRLIEAIDQVARVDLPFPLFVKPVAEGTGKGIGEDARVSSTPELTACCARLLSAFEQPVLVERYLPGREFTAGVVGSGKAARVLGVLEVNFSTQIAPIYSYHTKAHYEAIVDYALVEEGDLLRRIEEVTLAAWRGLNCRDGGRVDVRLDESDVPCVMELNPLAGLNPIHSDLPILAARVGWSYPQLIGEIVASAQERLSGARQTPRRE